MTRLQIPTVVATDGRVLQCPQLPDIMQMETDSTDSFVSESSHFVVCFATVKLNGYKL